MAEQTGRIGLAEAGTPHAGEVVYPPGGTYGPRIQPDYQLVVLYSGSLLVELDGQQRALHPSEVALLRPGRREFFRFSRTTESRHGWLALQRPPLPDRHLAALDSAPFSLPLTPAMDQLMQAAVMVLRDVGIYQTVLAAIITAALALYVEEAWTRGLIGESVREHPSVIATRELVNRRLTKAWFKLT